MRQITGEFVLKLRSVIAADRADAQIVAGGYFEVEFLDKAQRFGFGLHQINIPKSYACSRLLPLRRTCDHGGPLCPPLGYPYEPALGVWWAIYGDHSTAVASARGRLLRSCQEPSEHEKAFDD